MTVQNKIAVFLTTSGAAKTPAALAENALSSFQKAQEDLATAQQAIDAQIAQKNQLIADTQAEVDDAQSHTDRLTRVRQKLADLLA